MIFSPRPAADRAARLRVTRHHDRAGPLVVTRSSALAPIALLVGVVLAACAARGAGSARPPEVTRPALAASAPGPARPRTGDGDLASARVLSFCAVRPAKGRAAALSRVVAASLGAELVPLGISADGRTAYVSAWTSRFAGVAALSLATGALHPIRSFADPATDQADGSWDGRWLVWAQTHSLQSLDGFTMFGWDSATGRLMRLGHSLSAPTGQPWPSPWHAPAVSGGHAAWAQGDGPGGLVQIRLADLRTGRVIVIRQGHLQAPFFDAGLLVWPESDRPGAPTTLRAYSLAQGRLVALPPVLAAVVGTDFVVADGTRTAYFSPGLTALYYSSSPAERARVVLRLPPGVEFGYLAIAPGLLAWTTTQATYLASTKTGGYARVTPRFGFPVTGPGPAVLISDAPASQAAHPILPLHVLTAATGWPGCR